MQILAAAQDGRAELFTSPALLAELHRCLGRSKFARQIGVSGIGRDELFLGYAELATALAPAPIAPVILADPADDHVLACALAARGDAIVSGDRHLLALDAYRGIPILTPADALGRIPFPR